MRDETNILLLGSNGWKYVRHGIEELLHHDCFQANLKKEVLKKEVKDMIQLCMSANGIGHIHVMNRTLNVGKYIENILKLKLILFIRYIESFKANFLT